jgi:hypothetical protein
MSESMERAHETMHHEAHGDPWARGAAVLVSVLAAALAISEVAGKSAQTSYLTHHIELSDGWAFYQAKNLRQVVRGSEVSVLESLPNAAEPATQKRIQDARDYQARMRDDPASGEGMKQLAEKAKHKEEERGHAFHLYHQYEFVSGSLQIAIVLSAASVVTRIRPLTVVAGLIGLAAGAFGLGVALGWA